MIDGLRWVHIGCGTVALLTGYAAMAVKAGSPRHRLLGKVYVGGMVGVTLTAVPIALYRPNPFLLGVALFSAYFVFRAWETATNRSSSLRPPKAACAARFARALPPLDAHHALARSLLVSPPFAGQDVLTVKRNGDVTLRARAVAMGLGVVSAFGVLGGIASWPGGLAVVAVVFGCIGLLVAFQDLRRFARGPLKGRDRIAQHLVSSGAALIATTTAMLVTVGRWLPDAIPGFVWWLLPTVLVTPLLVRWSGQVQRGELRF